RRVRTFAPPFNYRLRRPGLRAILPAWDVLADEDVDLEFHFRRNALPRPGGERELGVLVGRLHSRALDPRRPMWECHLIEGLEGDSFAIYFKVHHALIDGVGGVKRFTQMISPDPAEREIRPLWSIGPTKRPTGDGSSAITEQRGRIARAGDGAKVIYGLAKVAAGMVREARRPLDEAAATPFVVPDSILNGRIGQQRRVATQTYEFERIRAVSKAADVTINEVFLAICAGGLRRYLAELGELPEQGLVAGTPVSVRPAGDDDTGNAFGIVVMKLATEIADPIERIAAIHRSSTLAKEKLARVSRAVVEKQAALFMAPFIASQFAGLGGRVPSPYNVTISNVPGPLEPQYLVGARLESLAPIAILFHGVALFIAVFSTSGRFGVGFVGCRDTLPHMQRLAVYTGQALEELEGVLAAR
ncbi:MAG: wax ester/triacylglycerol synthase family O-acyltransferase, partial [Actinomycetota bacterium]|nr:wax ester/triacylglycerol synthase family O-acyltransferase [Actinomycetota bacterium]